MSHHHWHGGCRPRTIAPRHRRHSSPRCSCRVEPPICDARLIGLILGVATQACAGNGFGERRDRVRKTPLSRPQGAAETAQPSFKPRKGPQIGAYSSNTGTLRFARESRQDSNLQPSGYEASHCSPCTLAKTPSKRRREIIGPKSGAPQDARPKPRRQRVAWCQ